ncbi:MAG: hypothetical protein ABIG66_01355 [Candidatus Kerfeldbacteria bacterium]
MAIHAKYNQVIQFIVVPISIFMVNYENAFITDVAFAALPFLISCEGDFSVNRSSSSPIVMIGSGSSMLVFPDAMTGSAAEKFVAYRFF